MSDIAAASVLQLESLAEGNDLPEAYQHETALLQRPLPLAATNLPEQYLSDAQPDTIELGVPPRDDAPVFASEQPLKFEDGLQAPRHDAALHETAERLASAIHSGSIDDALTTLRDAHIDETNETQTAFGRAAGGADSSADPVNSGLAQIVWRALSDAPREAVHDAITKGLPEYAYEDDINARTSLHISAISGHLELVQACVQHGVDVRRCDVYGREALAYAAMHGHDDVCRFLLSLQQSTHGRASMVDAADQDGFTPLVHAVFRAHTATVRILLDFAQAKVAPPARDGAKDPSELVPLAIACQSGHADITRLLLERGARIEPNAEGLMPQALAARAGHADCLRLLIDARVDVNATEKGTLWTPLFFAAENGHVACVRVLLDTGAYVHHADEKQRHAVFYAAWNGWMSCVRILLDAAAAQPSAAPVGGASAATGAGTTPDMDLDGGPDAIPSLYLPPPIIPFRTYGHNYLDKRSLMSLSLTNKSFVLYKHTLPERQGMIPGLTSSLKLVLTPRTTHRGNEAGIPHTTILPLADDREELTFQIEDPHTFHLEWELFPMFGSSRIAKTALLPGVLSGITNRTTLQLPLFDWHLNVVGHVSFDVESVRPFESVQLQIGGRVETYWKSTLPGTSASAGSSAGTPSVQSAPLAALGGARTMTPSSAASPAVTDHAMMLQSTDTSSFVTASSLTGTYVNVVVQFSADLVPIAWADATLPVDVIAPRVSQVTAAQVAHIAEHAREPWYMHTAGTDALTPAQWREQIRSTPIALRTLLKRLPQHTSLALEIYCDNAQPVNDCIDAMLHAVNDVAARCHEESRSIFFSSACPSVCVALNWKQPNYAVFLICRSSTLRSDDTVPCRDARTASLKHAMRFAKDNNLLGVMLDGELLERVPELIPSVKSAGLVLITLTRTSAQRLPAHAPHESGAALVHDDKALDGFVEDGLVHYKSS